MISLHTIENIHQIFDTAGSRPLLVTCNDRQMWVCKYDVASQSLLNEFLAAEFAKIWKIKVPDISLITVKDEHIPDEMIPPLQKNWFLKECFGSHFLADTKEVDSTTYSLLKQKSYRDKLHDKEDFLKIALFDIWLANDDRNLNNFNLLINHTADNISFFYAIDHVAIFNTSSLNYGVYQLNEWDTILNTDLAKILFSKNTRLKYIVKDLLQNFYLCTEECKKQLPEILNKVPASWNINTSEITKQLAENIFTEKWTRDCSNTFLNFVQTFIRN